MAVALSELIFLNGYDLSCYLNKVGSDIKRDLKSADVFCTGGAKSYKKGLHGATVNLEGFNNFEPSTDRNIDGIFRTAVLADTPNLLTYSIQGAPGLAMVGTLQNTNYSIDEIEAGELIMASLSGESSQEQGKPGLMPGIWLAYNAAIASEITFPAKDNGTSATGYFLRIHNLTDQSPVTWQLEHSTNGTTWAAVGSGTVAANTATEVFSLTTAVSRYTRILLNSAGGTSKAAAAYIHGYKG